MILATLVSCVLFALGVAAMGWSLQLASAFATVEPVPRWGQAFGVALVSAIACAVAGVSFGCTFGLVLSLVGRPVAWLAQSLLVFAIGSTLTARGLKLSWGHGAVVWLIQQAVNVVVGLGLGGVGWLVWKLLGY